MYTISKRFTFDASHCLDQLPEGHKCARLHGHTYTVEVVLQSKELDASGFVVDYGDLAEFKKFIDSHLDHRRLNALMVIPPTAEHIAHWLFTHAVSRWPQVITVRVSETPNTWAEYRR